MLKQGKNAVQKPHRNLFAISPYTDDTHCLDLDTVPLQEKQLAKALAGLDALRADYATSPYADTFNWSEITASLRQIVAATGNIWKTETFYIVAFRSQIPPTTDYAHLGDLDKAAFLEAVKSGGFIKYWFGHPDRLGRNLATCIWRSKEHARRGGVGEAHRRASAATRFLYTDWKIERLALVITDEVAELKITPWVD